MCKSPSSDAPRADDFDLSRDNLVIAPMGANLTLNGMDTGIANLPGGGQVSLRNQTIELISESTPESPSQLFDTESGALIGTGVELVPQVL